MADDHDDDPDLSDREKELRKWNRPVEFQEFPKMLYRVTPMTAPVPPVDPRMHGVTTTTEHDRIVQVDLVCQRGIVDTADVEADLQAAGWVTDSGTAWQVALEAVQREEQRRENEGKETLKQALREVLEESLLPVKAPSIGVQIGTLRKEARWSIEKLAANTKLDVRLVKRHLKDEVYPTLDTIAVYEKTFTDALKRPIKLVVSPRATLMPP